MAAAKWRRITLATRRFLDNLRHLQSPLDIITGMKIIPYTEFYLLVKFGRNRIWSENKVSEPPPLVVSEDFGIMEFWIARRLQCLGFGSKVCLLKHTMVR